MPRGPINSQPNASPKGTDEPLSSWKPITSAQHFLCRHAPPNTGWDFSPYVRRLTECLFREAAFHDWAHTSLQASRFSPGCSSRSSPETRPTIFWRVAIAKARHRGGPGRRRCGIRQANWQEKRESKTSGTRCHRRGAKVRTRQNQRNEVRR